MFKWWRCVDDSAQPGWDEFLNRLTDADALMPCNSHDWAIGKCARNTQEELSSNDSLGIFALKAHRSF